MAVIVPEEMAWRLALPFLFWPDSPFEGLISRFHGLDKHSRIPEQRKIKLTTPKMNEIQKFF
jgi:hypothetical protein